MADDNIKNCVDITKIWIYELYKSPCFWLKLSLSIAIIILSSIGIYTVATSAFHYFNEPLSTFDPERLGQLGDFLGGTLNPIFGFLTVCLLLWSVFIQRKELKLTRDELERSAEALNGQLNLSQKEYNRKQLEEIINSLIKTIDIQFNEITIDGSISLKKIINRKKESINDYNINLGPVIKNIRHKHEFSQQIEKLIADINSLRDCMHELIYSENYVSSEVVRDYWIKKSISYMSDLSELGIVSGSQLNEYKSKLKN